MKPTLFKIKIEFQFVTTEEAKAFEKDLLNSICDDGHAVYLSNYLNKRKMFSCRSIENDNIIDVMPDGSKKLVQHILNATLTQI